MTIVVRAFAGARQALGRARLELELPDGSRVDDAWRRLGEAHPALAAVELQAFAVNRAYVSADTPLADGDELALIPPVSGG